MKKNKQEITAGDSSTNIQGYSVTVNQNGLTYSDVKHIAIDVFKANFLELSEDAKATAVQRAEELVENFLANIEKEFSTLAHKVQEPDIQYAIVNAQIHYARNGQRETLDLLTDLLKARFESNETSFKSVVINESIDALSKLTLNHIRFITVLFLVKNCKLSKVRTLIENINNLFPEDISNIQKNISFFEHLMYAGITTNDVSTLSHQNLEYFIRLNYPDELTEKIHGSTLEVLDPPVRKQFIIDQISESAFNKWNNSLLKDYTVTSVGKAIAVSYYNSIMKAKVNLDIWIKD
jgi:hypothetical protein